MIHPKKKLIEVALPLGRVLSNEERTKLGAGARVVGGINDASSREKSIRHGHPSTLHLWWARRPLAAARAVIFAQMVDDPSEYVETLRQDPKLRRKAEAELKTKRKLWEEAKVLHDKVAGTGVDTPEPGPEPTLEEILADQERQRLFRIIEDLVQWENTTNEEVLQQARDEIWQSWRRACAQNADHPHAKELFDRHKLPAFHDPFAGGGALPLEAQRLGLESYASDLNPVAVLINKAMIEIPPKFAGRPPVNPESCRKLSASGSWKGAQGLAEDVRYYGQWMREEAEKRIGHLYPKVEVTAEMAKERSDLKKYVGKKLTVIAWLWARTVKSPNPAFANIDVPLVSTFMLSTKAGKEAYVEPVIENGGYCFNVKMGKPKDPEAAKNGTKLARGANFMCLMSRTPMDHDYVRGEFQAQRAGERMMAIVAEGEPGRVYLSPTPEMEAIALQAHSEWRPEQEMNQESSNLVSGRGYGIHYWHELFTERQLAALTTLSDLVQEARERVKGDARAAGLMPADVKSLAMGGTGTTAYADAVSAYLGMAIDKSTDYNSALVLWSPTRDQAKTTFSRQALPMAWDFAETNVFAGAAGDIGVSLDGISRTLAQFGLGSDGHVFASDAQSQSISLHKVISTDPPYYDNIAYADLSDFFYVWLRRSLKPIFPDLFATLEVPKAEELVATHYRHGSKEKAEAFFLDGMTQAMHRLAEQAHAGFPVTIYYAFKQSETDSDEQGGTASTGWDTFLEAVIKAGFALTGTWPIRTERGSRSIGIGTNALASSIILVCRPREANAPSATRREFLSALKTELPIALAHLQRGNIAPVDLAQAAIGPGMAVYTRYARVLDAEGKPLTVREALALINQTLDEALAEQEGDFDADSRWALAWFENSGFAEGEYGVAETLSKAKNTSLQSMVQDGILTAKGGKVRLLRPDELSDGWEPEKDHRLTAWDMVHQLIRALEAGGEGAAAALVTKLGSKAETARELAYRLYMLCERKKRASEALSYNGLVQSWPEITRLAREGGKPREGQSQLFEVNEE
jgi:putative DNA methylase